MILRTQEPLMKKLFALALTLLLSPAIASAQITPEKAREAVTKVENAVVSVRAVVSVSMSMDGREMNQDEEENESCGVVINASGLTVASLGNVDPTSIYDHMMSGMGMEEMDFQVKADIKDLKLKFADGKEVSAEVVLRDNTRDLAFIKPKTPLDGPVPFINLEDSADAELLDPVIVVARMGKMANWITYARNDQVVGVNTRPRRMYMLTFFESYGSVEDNGALVLGPAGKLLGIQLNRKVQGATAEDSDFYLVVLPAREIATVAKQVPN